MAGKCQIHEKEDARRASVTPCSASPLGFSHAAPEADTPAPWRPATEAPEPPAGPQLRTLAVSDITPDSLRLSWSVAQGTFDSFVVQYQDIDGQPQALLVGGNQNKVRVSGLEPSTSYRFFLYGLHEGKRLGPVSADGTTGTHLPGPCIQASPTSGLGLTGLTGVPTHSEREEGPVEGGRVLPAALGSTHVLTTLGPTCERPPLISAIHR